MDKVVVVSYGMIEWRGLGELGYFEDNLAVVRLSADGYRTHSIIGCAPKGGRQHISGSLQG